MTLSDRAEEIMETLWVELVEQKKKECDASILKDDEVISELLNSECIKCKDDKISLTHKGMDEAKSCVRRHRLAERLMVDVLDVKKKLVHETSCKFEHLLHKGLDEHICTILGHPETCPHGSPIPKGYCCKEARGTAKKLIVPLHELEVDKKAKVSYLRTNDKHTMQKIIAIGALPNVSVLLIQKFPSYLLQIGKSQFAIDRELASKIYVRVS